jgi:hypothetical protein
MVQGEEHAPRPAPNLQTSCSKQETSAHGTQGNPPQQAGRQTHQLRRQVWAWQAAVVTVIAVGWVVGPQYQGQGGCRCMLHLKQKGLAQVCLQLQSVLQSLQLRHPCSRFTLDRLALSLSHWCVQHLPCREGVQALC